MPRRTPAKPRRAHAVDGDVKTASLKRLKRIEGQVRGVQKMVEDERYCADVITQISAIREALRSVGRELMRNHLRHCAAAALRSEGAEAEAMLEEILGLIDRSSR